MAVRATSTVLDVAVFLLLVGASIGTLAAGSTAVADTGTNPAAQRAEVLATSTATVTYSVAHDRGSEAVRRRHAHATLASHLAATALSRTTYRGQRLSHRGTNYARAVGRVVRGRLAHRIRHTNVTVVWRPYPEAPISGRTGVGEAPPPTADVAAATLRVPTGMRTASPHLRAAANRSGFRGVAETVARRIIEGLYPHRATTMAMRSGDPLGNYTAVRYERAVDAFRVRPPRAQGNVTASNERMIDRLADAMAADLRVRYDTPVAAARVVQPGTARLTVRTWSG